MTPGIVIYGAVFSVLALSLLLLFLHIPTIDWVPCKITRRYFEFLTVGDVTTHKAYVYIEANNFCIPYESQSLYEALNTYACINVICKVEKRLKGFKLIRNIILAAPTSYVKEDKEFDVV